MAHVLVCAWAKMAVWGWGFAHQVEFVHGGEGAAECLKTVSCFVGCHAVCCGVECCVQVFAARACACEEGGGGVRCDLESVELGGV